VTGVTGGVTSNLISLTVPERHTDCDTVTGVTGGVGSSLTSLAITEGIKASHSSYSGCDTTGLRKGMCSKNNPFSFRSILMGSLLKVKSKSFALSFFLLLKWLVGINLLLKN
jgi:hypothetical protein